MTRVVAYYLKTDETGQGGEKTSAHERLAPSAAHARAVFLFPIQGNMFYIADRVVLTCATTTSGPVVSTFINA